MKITIFHSDEVEKLTFLEVAKEAKSRGHEVRFTEDFSESAEVGITAASRARISNARFKVVGLHGLDQGRWSVPNFWSNEDWSDFDIGLLPGEKRAASWRAAGRNSGAHPRLGVFVTGWPKADPYLAGTTSSGLLRKSLEQSMGLPPGKRILYAPGFETDSKQLDVMAAANELDAVLLVKHEEPRENEERYADLIENIKGMNTIAAQSYPNTVILDPSMNIFDAVCVSDVLVTDESSVSLEASLCGIPVVSVADWPMRVSNAEKARPVLLPEEVKLVAKRATLTECLGAALRNPEEYLHESSSDVSFRGKGAARTLDIIEDKLSSSAGRNFPPVQSLYRPSCLRYTVLEVIPSRAMHYARRVFGTQRRSAKS